MNTSVSELMILANTLAAEEEVSQPTQDASEKLEVFRARATRQNITVPTSEMVNP